MHPSTDGYESRVFWWELVELGRKLLLVGYLALVSPGSILQLFIALVAALALVAIDVYVRPFDSLVKTTLSRTSGFALVLTLLGTLGLSLAAQLAHGLLTTGLMLVVLIVAGLVLVVAATCMLAAKLVTEARRPTFRLMANGEAPVLTLPPGHFLGFLSHTWGTGQDQAHTIVRQLQLLLPGVRIWLASAIEPCHLPFPCGPFTQLPPSIYRLDVDYLDDVSMLEQSVDDSQCLIIFLSKGCTTTADRTPDLHSLARA